LIVQQKLAAEYEFDATQNHSLDDLAKKMRFVGLTSVGVGALLVATGIAVGILQARGLGFGIANGAQGLFLVLLGLWTRAAGARFGRIVDTQGCDIAHLMGAIGQLRRIYGLQRVAVLGLIVGIVLTVQLSILFMIHTT
jgi:hypothetical protein